MKAVMVMFDSLNRRLLPNYGCDWTYAPNFRRLGERTVTFDTCYAGSLPCMPARRELHTGRHNFSHRSWGPLEPFDESMPELLKRSGVYTHLVSDHYHYWEDGGATYHSRYSSWEGVRGQEGDPWQGAVGETVSPSVSPYAPLIPGYEDVGYHEVVNRRFMDREELQPQARTFSKGLAFMERNSSADNWFLQIETFDPHEPFYTQRNYKELYPHTYEGQPFDWPPYNFVQEGDDAVAHIRFEYAALLSMCDHYLGKVLDAMDRLQMWDDTMLIVNTDHGYLLGERGWWSKTVMPVYNEIAHLPFFCWDPRSGKRGERRQSLVQTIDIAPTLLDFFGLPIPESMKGVPLGGVAAGDRPVREWGLFGYHGGHANITDGRYLYMRAPATPANAPLYEYTLMPTHMRSMFSVDELQDMTVAPPFQFTRGCPVMKIRARSFIPFHQYGDRLYDLAEDPGQEHPVDDPELEARLLTEMRTLLESGDAPSDEFIRLGIPKAGSITRETISARRKESSAAGTVPELGHLRWGRSSLSRFMTLLQLLPEAARAGCIEGFGRFAEAAGNPEITREHIQAFIGRIVPEDRQPLVRYLVGLAGRFD